ncbi:MAG: SDR family NAD(P)-dependent oxidoreductase [Xanthomonadales bacterium]|nr:SDR family NAD(P)-dependent oxidoreductase [Xanthomonadales bacterium]
MTQGAHVLITGGSSGIGLGLVRELVANRHVAAVTAVSRRATQSDALSALADECAGDRLKMLDCDLTDEASIERLPAWLRAHHPRLHLVINTAGILHDQNLRPERSITQLTRNALDQAFALNAFAPILLARAVMPLLDREEASVFASLSARVGSIGDNRLGGWYAYRASKAAQNQLIRTFAIELSRRNPKACCLLLHPGTVDTPLSTPFQANVPAEKLFSIERASNQLLGIIAAASPADSGRFIAWDGSDIAW